MKLEWFFFVLLFIWASVLVLKGISGSKKWALLFLIVVCVSTIAGAKKWSSHQALWAIEREKLAEILPREGRPDGYVSSKKCQACHPGEYSSWHRTFHRTMTQFASRQSVKGNFENQDLELDGENFSLHRE